MQAVVPTVLKMRYECQMEGPNIIYRVAAAQRGVLPSGVRPFKERTVLGSRLDDGVRNARHLGGERGHRLAAAIRIVGMPGDIAS